MNRTKYLIPILFVLGLQGAYAQTAKCKPKNRANKNKTWVVQNMQIGQTTWVEKDMWITIVGDTVKVKRDDVLISTFRIKQNTIIDSLFIERYPDGKIKRVDSLSTKNWPQTPYYFNFKGTPIYTHRYYQSGIPEKSVYYDQAGRDTLKKKWYPNGVLQECIRYNSTNDDSVIYRWNQEGILQEVKSPLEAREYYPNGSLKSSTANTIIEKERVKCIRTYYAKGTLQSDEYYYYDEPCCTWSYYTEQGVLSRSVKKPFPSQITVGMNGVAEIVESRIFTFVEQVPEFPGGEAYLKKYLNEKLYPAICESRYPLKGKYVVRFVINPDGTVTFLNLIGQNHTAILDTVKKVVNQMPKWKPGKRNGKPLTTVFEIELEPMAIIDVK